MRIGIDARMYRCGLGIGRYIEKLIEKLEICDHENEYVIFLRKDSYGSYHPQNILFSKVCVDIPWYSLREQIILPLILAQYRLDCVHFPHFNVPIFYRKRYIVTIHDLILIKFPLSATSAATTRHSTIHWMKYHAYRWILSRATQHALAIITVSHYVKKDLITLLHLPEEKIHVVYEAADPPNPSARNILPPSVRKPYLFNAGNAYPHKNLETLLLAFKLLIKEHPNLSLVLCGQEDFFRKRLLVRIGQLALENHVIHLGCVNEERLEILYHNAILYVFPSFEEGFGLGGLEAMYRDVPVAASNSTCFKEIYGSAAVYFNPSDMKNMHDILKLIIEDHILRSSLVELGRACVRKYSWIETAEKTKKLYMSL